jgi:hypothetical protein
MDSFRRIAFLLALAASAVPAVLAQSESSSSVPAQEQTAAQSGQLSVQARIRARRAQRRATAIHDAYSQKYEAYVGSGTIRFVPGPDRQRSSMYAWNVGVTRYLNERLGVTVDGRGYFGTAYVGLNAYGLTRPSISEYNVMAGPTYRFYVQPKYAISGRVLAGYGHNNFSEDANGYGAKTLKLYPDGSTYAASVSVSAEYNLTPSLALRLSPEYFFTGYGSTSQASRGFTGSVVYRFGKQ